MMTTRQANNSRQMRQRGFTLLEMMISLTLMMSIVLATFQVYEFGIDSWNRGDEMLTETDIDTVTFSFMRKMFDKLVAENWVPERAKERKVRADGKRGNFKIFDGNHDKVRFAAPLPVHHGQNLGVYLFEFSVERLQGDVTSSLVVRYYPIIWAGLEETLAQDANVEMLMPNVKSIKVQYFGVQGAKTVSRIEKEPEWHDDWEEQHTLPLAIRLSIVRTEPPEGERMVADNYEQIVIRLARRYVR